MGIDQVDLVIIGYGDLNLLHLPADQGPGCLNTRAGRLSAY